MESPQLSSPAPSRNLRLWPGVLLLALQWFAWWAFPRLVPDSSAGLYVLLGGSFGGGLALVVWWAFFSRAPLGERWGALGLMAAAAVATRWILHPSVAQAGMGVLFALYIVPVLCLALVLWALTTRKLARRPRLAALGLIVFVACGAWGLLRSDGLSNSGGLQWAWRWSPTVEDQLAALPALPTAGATGTATIPAPGAEWPGFRGPLRNGIVHGAQVSTDWASAPPTELWRRPIGPAWSSFALQGERLYTQEQRGDDELVSCYDARTGEPLWAHKDSTRFWEANAGAGPRGTPTLHDGRVYSFGATGLVNVLDAATGKRVWSRNAATDAEVETPYWGFSSSPVVAEGLVFVAVSGRLVAYDQTTGEPRWLGPKGRGSYSSPHLVTLGGVPQVLLLNGDGATGFNPADGTVLWQHAWGGGSIVQPAFTAEGDVLIGTEDLGTRRVAVTPGPTGWTTTERWTSIGLKPYFNDFVVHGGHAYGFDGRILACIDLATGERKWKGGRYGNGQLVLLAEQNLLLVLSDEGELVLVRATPDDFHEVTRVNALTGKTWNHPVLVGDRLFVRNSEEMAAFRLASGAPAR